MRRQAISEMRDQDQVKKLFDVLAARHKDRQAAIPVSSRPTFVRRQRADGGDRIRRPRRRCQGARFPPGAGKGRGSRVSDFELHFKERRRGAAFDLWARSSDCASLAPLPISLVIMMENSHEIDLSGKTALVTGSTTASAMPSPGDWPPRAPRSRSTAEPAKVDSAVAAIEKGHARRQGEGRRRKRIHGRGLYDRDDPPGRSSSPRQQRRESSSRRTSSRPRTRTGAGSSRSMSCRACGCARLHAGHAEAQLGPHHLHLLESALNIPKEMIHYGMTKPRNSRSSRGLAEITRGTAVTVNRCCRGRRCRRASRPSSRISRSKTASRWRMRRRNSSSSFADLAAAAVCQRRGDRQHGDLCRLKDSSRPRRGAARRGRDRADHRVRCGMSAYVISELEVLDHVAGSRYVPTIAGNSDRAIWRALSGRGGAASLPRAARRGKTSSSSSFPRWNACANGMPRRNTPRR